MAQLVTLGPLALPTLKGEIVETVGDQLEAVGAGVVAGERRARPFPLTIPIRGEILAGVDRRATGLRLRRQVRALMENSLARLQGLYLNWSVDPEQNCWLLIGGGDLKYAQGGIGFGDFELALTDCYKVASLRTHRPARRVVAIDRHLGTTPRDILGTVFNTGFTANTTICRTWLPVAISDPVSGSTRFPLNLSTLSTAEGNVYVLDSTDGLIVDYEQAEGDMNKADVKVWDRQGAGATEASWERVYGSDQPLTAGDVPVLENGVVRALWDATNKRWDLQDWSGSAWVTQATVIAGSLVTTQNLTLLKAAVVEWSMDRAVLLVTALQSPEFNRLKIYVTLQRGWTAPRFEVYARDLDSVATPQIMAYAKSTGDATFQKSTGGAVAITSGGALGTFVGLGPHASLVGPGTDKAIWLAVVQENLTVQGSVLSSREGVVIFDSAALGYVSVWFGIGARATAATDALAHGRIGLWGTQTIPELVART
jgi:hypothetical protein